MSLADDLASSPKTAKYGARCGFCAWFAGLDEDSRAVVLEAIDDPTREGATLDLVWKRHGWQWTKNATQRHRRNECKQWADERSR